jgi:ferritin-like metal-binding protein YciE
VGKGEDAMARVENLRELYLNELEDLYDAEKRIVKALPKVAEAASDPELRDALLHHLEQTRGHVNRLERVFQGLGQSAKSKTCDGMKGILNEGEDTIDAIDDPAVRDAGIIAAAQRVEHYEIAAYGTVRKWAEQLNDTQGAQMLEQTLEEEKSADKKLTGIAINGTNLRADGTRSANL